MHAEIADLVHICQI